MSEREYDIVLLGATGFVGQLTAAYLAGRLPEGASWALAGRSLERLEAVREAIAEEVPSAASVPLVLTDSLDDDSVRALAESTRVVLSTVGPYMRYGEPLAAACAAAGTDYLDLCGESEFVDLMYLRYHQTAVASGARLIHACGFDSIPYDLGVLYTISQLPEGAAQGAIAVQGFGLGSGQISGGTYHSAVEALGRLKEAGRAARQRRSVERNAPDSRADGDERHISGVAGRPHREPIAGGWVVPAPTIDPQIVLRSARALDAYGPDFTYSHYLVTKRLVNTVVLIGGVGALAFLAQLPQTRKLALMMKTPGEGPDERRRERSFFRVRFVADVAGASGRLVTEVSGGDPGYGETAKMLAEAGMSAAFDGEQLPSAGRGGQMTTAVAFGGVLIDRLAAAGIRFGVLEDHARPDS